MKILLCVASLPDVDSSLNSFSPVFQPHTSLEFIRSAKILHHEVDVLETGFGIYQTSYKLTKALTLQKYHLALKMGFGNSYKEQIGIGSILNIVNEKPGDYGMMVNNEWKDYYELGLSSREDKPQQRGGFVNLNNAYMNIFLPFKKAVGVTVNHYADKDSFAMRREKYKADCETGDGLGFVYPCMYEKQNFYHLCAIERNMATGAEDFNLAKEAMNKTLTELLQKL